MSPLGRGVLVALLACIVPLSGCLSGDDDPDTDDANDGSTTTLTRSATSTAPSTRTSTSSTTQTTTSTTTVTTGPGNGTGNGTGPIGNGTGNHTGNATGNQTYAWTYENRTGAIAGDFIPLVATEVTVTEGFVVNNTTKVLVLNLTTVGDDVTLEVRPPGCGDADCGNETVTTDGQARMTFERPPPAGEWEAHLSISGTAGSGAADYVLTIERFEPGNVTRVP